MEEQFRDYFKSFIEDVIFMNDNDRADSFGQLMDKARELNCFESAFETAQAVAKKSNITLYETPVPFEKITPLAPFPINSLPMVLSEYLKAVAENIQVYNEMCVLPMLSVLSLCCQGKFLVQFPNTTHIESLNLYTVTIAKPGERKSGVFRSFIKPAYEYQKQENERRKPLITEYQTKKRFLLNQLESTTKGKNANSDHAQEIAKELDELEPVHILTLNITDCTPEALVAEMSDNNEAMGILNDECGVFDQIAGLYSNGKSNIDIFLKAYDGAPYTVIRRTKENIHLEHPVLTFGLMAQPDAFRKALVNPQFAGRGLIHRFLFSFPESMQGRRNQNSLPVPETVQNAYNELIKKLLAVPRTEKPLILKFNKSASLLLENYFDFIERRLIPDGQLEYISEWANKLYAKCIRIAGILHLCEHSPEEAIDERTAQQATNITMWAENHAHKAFNGVVTEDETTKNAKYILSKIKEQKKAVITLRELMRLCQKLKKAEDFNDPVALLEDMKYITEIPAEYFGKGRKPSPKYRINPFIFNEK